VYGPHDNTIVPIILKLAEKDNIPMINGGTAVVDVTYVENYVDAVKKSLKAKDAAWNHAYNISNGDPITMREWFAEVLKIFDVPFRPKDIPVPMAKAMAGLMEAASVLPFGPKKPAMTRFTVGYMARSMTLSLERAKDMIGYAPRIGTREGFERYAEWYRGRVE
jgi:nucleoside-diphosphate-sugar epimerase